MKRSSITVAATIMVVALMIFQAVLESKESRHQGAYETTAKNADYIDYYDSLTKDIPEDVAREDFDDFVTKPQSGNAYKAYENPETGYGVYIDDRADLLPMVEEKALTTIMQGVTEYGNAVFVTKPIASPGGIDKYSEDYYLDNFGAYNSGTLFLIDPLELYIYSEGDMYDVLGKSYAQIIADNVYTYCKPGSYLQCAMDVFSQIADVAEGRRVPRPMKYICNIILGLLIAFFITYIVVDRMSRLETVPDKALIKAAYNKFELSGVTMKLVSQTKTYTPRSSGGYHSSGHRSSHHSGGHHGGGGGHRH